MSKKKKVLMMVLAALIGLLLLACAAFYVVFDVPNWQKLDASKLSALAQTSSMYDAQGELMSELRGAENRNIVSLDEIPMHTRQAFLAAEDLRFYEHRGIDVYRILGALRSNIKNGTFAEGEHHHAATGETDAPERRKDHSAQAGRNPSRLPNRSGIQQG